MAFGRVAVVSNIPRGYITHEGLSTLDMLPLKGLVKALVSFERSGLPGGSCSVSWVGVTAFVR